MSDHSTLVAELDCLRSENIDLKAELERARGEIDYLTHQLGDAVSGDCDVMKTNRRLEANVKSLQAELAEARGELQRELISSETRCRDIDSLDAEIKSLKAACLSY